MVVKSKKTKFGKPLPLNEFHDKVPDLLLVHIFSFLGPLDLKRVGNVCKTWSMVIKDETIWKLAFERLFGNSILKRLNSSWRIEYLVRAELLRSLEFSRFYIGSLNSRTSSINVLSFAKNPNNSKTDLLAVGHVESGVCALLEAESGKFLKFISFESAQRQATCLYLSTTTALLGFFTGQVAISSYNSTSVTFFPPHRSHAMPISALALSKYSIDSTILAASGSQDGRVCVWDASAPRLLYSLNGFNFAVSKLLVNVKYTVGLDNNRLLCLWKLAAQEAFDLEPLYSILLPSLVLGMEFSSDGRSLMVFLEDQPSRVLCFDSLSWSEYSHPTPVSCFYLDASMEPFFALGCQSSILVFDKLKKDPIKQLYPNHSSKLNQPLRSIYFDELKAVGYYENDILGIWDIISGRMIRKFNIAYRNHAPRSILNRQLNETINLILVNRTRLIATVSGKALIIGFGAESAHLIERPKRSKKLSSKTPENSKMFLKNSLLEIEEQRYLDEEARKKLIRLQGLIDLTDEEAIQYALSISQSSLLSASNAIPEHETQENIDVITSQVDNLGLTEEEAIQLAMLLSQE